MKLSRIFFALFCVDSLLAAQACGPRGNKKRYAVLKALLMPLLFCGCAFLREKAALLPLIALACGWAGDILLIGKSSRKLFELGMLAFAAGHILYIINCLCLIGSVSGLHIAAAGVFFVAYALFLVFGLPRLKKLTGKLRTAAIVYAFILALLGFAATLLCLESRSAVARTALAGALLFIFSDSMLARQHFMKRSPYGNSVVILSYAAAQACLAIGLTLLS